MKGQDLLDLGYRPGPRFKEIFDLLLERKLAGDLRSKKEEIAFLLSHLAPVPGFGGRIEPSRTERMNVCPT